MILIISLITQLNEIVSEEVLCNTIYRKEKQYGEFELIFKKKISIIHGRRYIRIKKYDNIH